MVLLFFFLGPVLFVFMICCRGINFMLIFEHKLLLPCNLLLHVYYIKTADFVPITSQMAFNNYGWPRFM